ncbi:hypothetical protein [Achromobacter xylosoxidans]|uniref:hypothetical protein n=1 Tax=Alcaligenes xylosoxydans xylosoxydans TaxID=85698 RepID=UPI0012A81102|nr:hypothetical protein [Achromobacter xylosoxidans]CUR70308.1 hypothetical protein BN2877_57550 [Achromobacter xylosoxidans]
MPVYINTDFRGHWPVGTAAVVVADTPDRAAKLLEKALDERGLVQVIPPVHMVPISHTCESVAILCDGNY